MIKSTGPSGLKKMSKRMVQKFRSLREDCSALAFIEFAYMLPIIMVLGLGGIELANLAVANMRVSQIALTAADNISRVKAEIPLGAPQLREVDINDSFEGARIQGGKLLLQQKARVIVSSLQQNAEGGQWIAWQRCWGDKSDVSNYGVQGTGASGTGFPGMGPTANRITAEAGTAIIFAEIEYDYEPIALGLFWQNFGNRTIRKEASFYVRDRRDLTQVYNPSPAAPVRTC
jgi:hypothetical protein